jgi:hypothetical protein
VAGAIIPISALQSYWKARQIEEESSLSSFNHNNAQKALRVDRQPSAFTFAAPSYLPVTQGQRWEDGKASTGR